MRGTVEKVEDIARLHNLAGIHYIHIVAHLGEMISEVESSSLLPMPQYPKYFQTQFNDSVARSLNVVVDEPARAFSRKPGARQP